MEGIPIVTADSSFARHDVEELDRVFDDSRHVELSAGATIASDAVIHCAAHADVRHNWINVARIEQDNLIATLRVLEAARCGRVDTFVFVSTGAVYAAHDGPVDEDTVCRATSPYAASKLACEAYVQAYAEKCEWRWYILRPAACVGSGYHHGHIADFVRMAREGTIYALDDGTVDRPAVHVEDVAETLVKLATGETDAPSGIYNVTGGLWNWKRTVSLMGGMRAAPVNYEAPNGIVKGWLGGSQGATWDSMRLARYNLAPRRSIEQGVHDALRGLGWPT